METIEGLSVKELFSRRAMLRDMLGVCKDEGSKLELIKNLKEVERELWEIGELIRIQD